MRREFCTVLVLALLVTPSRLRGKDFRVEWLTGKRIDSLTLKAGAESLRLCSVRRPKQCLTVRSGTSAGCVRNGSRLRCNSGDVAEQFEKFISTSAAPFQIEAAVAKLVAGENSRTGEVRLAEVLLSPHGLRVLVSVDLESYVAGVLAGEASTLQSPAALEAMAVVARTWALRRQGRHRGEGFDFCSLTHCQFFRLPLRSGNDGQSEIVRAVFETRGKVLKYHGQLVDPYFSADCGGVTEAAAEIWPDQAAPYLVSFTDPYCAGSDHSSWQRSVLLAAVNSVVREHLKTRFIGPLREIRIEDRDTSGRARRLRLEGQSYCLVQRGRISPGIESTTGMGDAQEQSLHPPASRKLCRFHRQGTRSRRWPLPGWS